MADFFWQQQQQQAPALSKLAALLVGSWWRSRSRRLSRDSQVEDQMKAGKIYAPGPQQSGWGVCSSSGFSSYCSSCKPGQSSGTGQRRWRRRCCWQHKVFLLIIRRIALFHVHTNYGVKIRHAYLYWLLGGELWTDFSKQSFFESPDFLLKRRGTRRIFDSFFPWKCNKLFYCCWWGCVSLTENLCV